MNAQALAIDPAAYQAELEAEITKQTPDLRIVETPATAKTREPAANALMHSGAYKLLGAVNFGILAAFWIVFQGHAEALFMVAISGVYLAAYMGTPWMMSRIGGRVEREEEKGTFSDFLSTPFETWTGIITGREALLQVLLIPGAVLMAVIGMTFIIAGAR